METVSTNRMELFVEGRLVYVDRDEWLAAHKFINQKQRTMSGQSETFHEQVLKSALPQETMDPMLAYGIKEGVSSLERMQKNINPFGLNILAQSSRLIVHMQTRDVTKGGIVIPEQAKKAMAEADRANDSKLYYIIGVSEDVYPKYTPGMWVLLDPEAMGHQFKLDGKEMMFIPAYAVAGVVTYHEEPEVEDLYKRKTSLEELKSKDISSMSEAEGRAHVDKLNEAGKDIDGESYQFIPKS